MSLAIVNTHTTQSIVYGGLYIIHPTNPRQLLAPLLHTQIHSNITHVSTQTTLEQRYHFPQQFIGHHPLIHARYEFPLDENSAVCAFSAKINNTTIMGVCKEKKTARAEYQQAVAANQSAVLLEQKAANIFTIDLGAIDAGSYVTITLTYISYCDDEGRNTIRFNLPQTIAPRYQPTFLPNPLTAIINERNDLWNDDPNTTDVVYNALTATINVVMPVPIMDIRSPSHTITSNPTNDKRAVVTLSIGGDNYRNNAQSKDGLSKDFILLIECAPNALDAPRAIIERHSTDPQSVAIQVAFTPRSLSLYEQKSTVTASVTTSSAVSRAQTELVFIMDRSGSMGGASMTALKATMQLIMRSLNNQCLFNLVGFGDRYDTLFPHSKPYDDNSLELATQYIQKMDANFGGTEMFLPMNFILSQNYNNNNDYLNHNIPRQIFLLTDGQITDVNQLVQLVAKHVGRSRVFTFGIGNSVDRELCKRVSIAGRGECEFVSGNTDGDMAAKVIRQLQRALQPALTDVNIDWSKYNNNKNAMSDVSAEMNTFMQTPSIIPAIFPNTRTVIYALNATVPSTSPSSPLVLKYRINGREEEINIPMDDVTYNGTHIHALAARARLSELEYAESRSAPAEGTALALKYSLASKWTSFVAVDKDNQSRIRSFMSEETEDISGDISVITSGGGGRGGGGMQHLKRRSAQTSVAPVSASFASFGSAFSQSNSGIKCGIMPSPAKPMAKSTRESCKKESREAESDCDDGADEVEDESTVNFNGHRNAPMKQVCSAAPAASRSFSPVTAVSSFLSGAFGAASRAAPAPASAPLSLSVASASAAAPAPAPAAPAAPASTTQVYSNIIQAQKASGLWQANQSNINIINQLNNNFYKTLTLNKIQQLCQKHHINNNNNDLMLTIIILYILQHEYKTRENEWSLLSLKAENYLKSNQQNYEQIIANMSNEV